MFLLPFNPKSSKLVAPMSMRLSPISSKVGKDGIDAGTYLVPNAVPGPIARLSVSAVAVTLTIFILKSFSCTALTVLATMGLIYFVFIFLNKDDSPRGPRGGISTEESLEEARRIMEKYK